MVTELKKFAHSLQSVNRNGGNALLPPEGRSAAASLFALIVESELTGDFDMSLCFSSVSATSLLCFLVSSLMTVGPF